ncbi:hypothetical protein AAC387_Pa04g1566 [Persea americana]
MVEMCSKPSLRLEDVRNRAWTNRGLNFCFVEGIWERSLWILRCRRGIASPTPSDPNKHSFPAYGNAATLFVQMGAYRGGPFALAVVGLAQISAMNGDVPACVTIVSTDILAH